MSRPESIALEFYLPAASGPVIQIKQQIANGPPLECGYERAQVWLIVGADSNDFGCFNMTDAQEIPGGFFIRKGERTGPWLFPFLIGNDRAVLVKQKEQLLAMVRGHATSTLSSPRRIAAARVRTSAG